MNTDNTTNSKSKYVKAFRERQKALGRKGRLLFLTDEEFEQVKKSIQQIRSVPF